MSGTTQAGRRPNKYRAASGPARRPPANQAGATADHPAAASRAAGWPVCRHRWAASRAIRPVPAAARPGPAANQYTASWYTAVTPNTAAATRAGNGRPRCRRTNRYASPIVPSRSSRVATAVASGSPAGPPLRRTTALAASRVSGQQCSFIGSHRLARVSPHVHDWVRMAQSSKYRNGRPRGPAWTQLGGGRGRQAEEEGRPPGHVGSRLLVVAARLLAGRLYLMVTVRPAASSSWCQRCLRE